MGIAKCRSRVCLALYWPKINKDTYKMVSNCDTCELYQYKQQNERCHQHDVLATPWVEIGTYLFTLNGADYLIVVDYTSDFPEIVTLRGTISKQVIAALKLIMARFGILKIVLSDNMPQFSSAEFLSFAKFYNFQSKSSSPEYPQSNGRAEKSVKIAKKLITKSAKNNEYPHLALLSYRPTPLECGKSWVVICELHCQIFSITKM